MKKAVIYTRQSCDTNRQTNSVRVQLELINEFANNHGYNVVKVFSEFETGRNNERIEFSKCIEFAQQQNCYVLALRVDRIGRQISLFAKIEHLVKFFRFVQLGDSEVSIMLLSILLAVSQNESELLSKRVKSTMASLKKSGRTFGSPSIRTTCQPLGAKKQKQLAIEFARSIKSILNDLIKAGYKTTKQLCCKLNELGVKTRTGGHWTEQNLYRMRVYIRRMQ